MSKVGRVVLRNYRCFTWTNPATLDFGDGFTAFVGPNNTGKSTALRAVYELRNFWSLIPSTWNPGHNYQGNPSPVGVSDVVELANDDDPTRFQIEIDIPLSSVTPPSVVNQYVAIGITCEFNVVTNALTPNCLRILGVNGVVETYDSPRLRSASPESGVSITFDNQTVKVSFVDLNDFLVTLALSRYFPAFRNAINEGAGQHYDISIGTSLVTTWDGWKAGANKAQKVAIGEVEREIAGLLGFRSLQINADNTNTTLDVIIDEKPKKLYEVGAGVAQLIITLSAALVSKPTYLLIDEPELNLHPSLQLRFLATLGSYTQYGLLYATHSIGLARSTAARIMAVSKSDDGSSQMRLFGTNATNFGEWLGELSYSMRAELGCEELLLVEGPTELLCFQELLRKVKKDGKFVLIQLGGSSLIRSGIKQHLSELFRIVEPSKICAVIDSERLAQDAALSPERAAFVRECGEIGIDVHVLERRAIENYFVQSSIDDALGPIYEALQPFQKLESSAKPWRKADNWKIAREMSLEPLENTDLGKLLFSL